MINRAGRAKSRLELKKLPFHDGIVQVDLSGKEEVYSLMGYSVFSSKAFIF